MFSNKSLFTIEIMINFLIPLLIFFNLLLKAWILLWDYTSKGEHYRLMSYNNTTASTPTIIEVVITVNLTGLYIEWNFIKSFYLYSKRISIFNINTLIKYSIKITKIQKKKNCLKNLSLHRLFRVKTVNNRNHSKSFISLFKFLGPLTILQLNNR